MEVPETVAKLNPLSLGCLPQEFCHCKEKLTNEGHFYLRKPQDLNSSLNFIFLCPVSLAKTVLFSRRAMLLYMLDNDIFSVLPSSDHCGLFQELSQCKPNAKIYKSPKRMVRSEGKARRHSGQQENGRSHLNGHQWKRKYIQIPCQNAQM